MDRKVHGLFTVKSLTVARTGNGVKSRGFYNADSVRVRLVRAVVVENGDGVAARTSLVSLSLAEFDQDRPTG